MKTTNYHDHDRLFYSTVSLFRRFRQLNLAKLINQIHDCRCGFICVYVCDIKYETNDTSDMIYISESQCVDKNPF